MAQHIIQHFILTETDLNNGYIGSLFYTTSQENINVQIRNANSQFKILDFIYNEDKIYWTDELSSILAIDDILIVDYDSSIESINYQNKEERIISELTYDNISNGYIRFDNLTDGAMSPVKFFIRHSPTLSQLPNQLSASFSEEFSNYDFTYGFNDTDFNKFSSPVLPTSYSPSVSGNSLFIYWKDSGIDTLISKTDIIQVNYINPNKESTLYREIFQITDLNIFNNQISLTNKISEVVEIIIRNGPSQLEFYDYKYNPLDDYITFSNLGSSLSIGDNIEICYYVSNFTFPELLKKNEDFSYSNAIKTLSLNPKWSDEYNETWNFFEATQNKVFSSLREKTLNFNANIRDPEICNIKALDNLAIEVDFPTSNIIPLDKIPPDLERLLNIFSINKTQVLESNKVLTDNSLHAILSSQIAVDIFPLASLTAMDGSYYPLNPEYFINTTENKLNSPINLFTPIFNPSAYLKNELPPTGQIEAWNLTGTLINDLSGNRFVKDSNYLSYMRQYYKTHLTEKLNYLYDEEISTTQDYSDSPILLYQQNKKNEALEYLSFLDSIWPCSGFCYKPAYSGEVIDAASYLLMDASLRFSYKRENIHLAAQRYSIAGTPIGAKKLTEEELRRNFTKPSCWRLVTPDVNSLTIAVSEKDSCVASTTAEFLSEKYFPDFCGISGLIVDVIEYNDKTSYLNLSASSIDQHGGNYRFWENQSPSANSEYDLLGLSGNGYSEITGNLYFNYIPSETQIINTFFDEYAIKSSEFSKPSGYTLTHLNTNYPVASAFVSGILFSNNRNFLPDLWNKFAISHLTGEPSELPDLASMVEPAKTTIDMIVAELKYSGTSSGLFQASNFKNFIYPTVAPAPTLENLVEIPTFKDSIPLAETILPSQTLKIIIEENISEIGMPINSWKTFNQDFHGYQTNFEQSFNLDYNQQVNDVIDRDGPYYPKTLNKLINLQLNNNLSNVYSELSSDFRSVYGWLDLRSKEEYQNFIERRLNLWSADIINLSGSDWRDIDNTVDYTSEDFIEFTGQRITQTNWDPYGNNYYLYKGIGTDNLESPSGRLFIKLGNEPLPFPASIPWITTTAQTSADVISQTILDYSLITSEDTVTIDESNPELITIYKTKVGIKEEILEYYPLLNSIRIADWRCMGLFIPSDAGAEGLDDILSTCYSFGIQDDIVHAVGKRKYYNENTNTIIYQDVLAIFGLEYIAIPVTDNTCCYNFNSTIPTLNILSVSSQQNRILKIIVLS